MSCSPRFSAHRNSPSRVLCMVIIGLRVPVAPPCLYSAAREGSITNRMTGTPDQGQIGGPF
jgi:hypothetical protein